MTHSNPPAGPAPAHDAKTAGDKWYARDRLGGLRRFALAITLLNVVGHAWLGFEQSWAHPLAALAAAYAVELLMEWIDSRQQRRAPRYRGGWRAMIDFFLPAHISGLAVAMLLYPGDRLMPVVLAAAVAVASKHVFRITVGGRGRHFLNPSNFGITVTLVLFPWVGIAPPYQFTENLLDYGNWVFPAIIICSGTLLNTLFTRRLPLILTWLGSFALLGAVRAALFGTPIPAALMPMTGVAFLLFTFYMVTDPPTSPGNAKGQVAFAASVALLYNVLMVMQVVFGLFFALTIVCTVRGMYIYATALAARRTEEAARSAAPPSQVSAPESSPAEPTVLSPQPAMMGRAES
jgi:hypothetical protein